MRRCFIPILALSVLIALSFSLEARSRKHSGAGENSPGVFDYYLMSLSWSPQYCSGDIGTRDIQQCTEGGKRFGFVMHGLWPQYEHGYPEACGDATMVPQLVVTSMLPLMPSPRLIQHEWEAHGTCSGLKVNDYFLEIRKASATVRIPDEFQQPREQVMMSPTDIKAKFAASNPLFPAEAIKVQCGGRYLSEVRVCLTRDLRARACTADVRDTCKADSIIVRPVK